jgi:hypothetical protein
MISLGDALCRASVTNPPHSSGLHFRIHGDRCLADRDSIGEDDGE